MIAKVSKYIKSVVAGVATFAATLGLVLQDDAISLDELNVLKAAAVALVVAVGVALAPKNRP